MNTLDLHKPASAGFFVGDGMSADTVRVYTPLRDPLADFHRVEAWDYADWPAGMTLAEMFPGTPVLALVDGVQVPAELIERARFKTGVTVWVRPIPQGKYAGVIVAAVEIAAAIAINVIPGVGQFLSASAISAITTSLVISGTLSLGMGIYGLLTAPTAPRLDTPGAFNSLTGQSNQLAQFVPIPRLFGRRRYFPPVPMTAQPYTDAVGDDNYLTYKLLLGYGPLSIGGHIVGGDEDARIDQTTALAQDDLQQAPIQIGGTDIHTFDDVQWQIGRPDQVDIYTDRVVQVGVGWTTSAQDTTATATRTTEPGATRFAVDFQSVIFSSGKGMDWGEVDFSVEWRKTGSSDAWTQESVTLHDRDKTSSARLGSYRFPASAPLDNDGTQTYDVRVTKTGQDFGSSSHTANVTWTALRSYLPVRAFQVPGTVVMDLRIRATDQLSGQIDQLSVLATSVLDVYNPTTQTWARQPTRNPAWAFASVLCDAANMRPIRHDQLDVASFASWAAACDAKSISYDAVLDDSANTLSRMRDIASAGYALYTVDSDTRVRAVLDTPQAGPRDVVTPRTMWDYRVQFAAFSPPDALRVQYTDPATWQPAERLVFWDGFDETTAQNYLSVTPPGCTSADAAWIFGRRYLGNLRLRAVETHTYTTNYRYFDYGLGDVVHIGNDTVMVGSAWGRVKSVNGAQVTMDVYCPMPDAGMQYGIEVQHVASGTISSARVVNSAPGSDTLTLVDPMPEIAPDDVVSFGEFGRVTTAAIVTRVEPLDADSATITAVPAAPELATVADGTIPAPDPDMTLPPNVFQLAPAAPSIINIVSDFSAAATTDSGAKLWRVVVNVAAGSGAAPAVRLQVQARLQGSVLWTYSADAVAGQAAFGQFAPADVIDVRVRAVAANGMSSGWIEQDGYAVDARLPNPPASVAVAAKTFSVQLTPEGGDPASVYQFWRSQALLPEAQIETDAQFLTTAKDLQDTDLTPGTTYYYYVRTENAYGVSDWLFAQATTSEDMSALAGRITKDALDAEINDTLDKVTGDADTPGTIANVIQQVAGDALRDGVAGATGLGVLLAPFDPLSVTTAAVARSQDDKSLLTTLVQQEAGARSDADDAQGEITDQISARLGALKLGAEYGFEHGTKGQSGAPTGWTLDGPGGAYEDAWPGSDYGSELAYGAETGTPGAWTLTKVFALAGVGTFTASARTRVLDGSAQITLDALAADGTVLGSYSSTAQTAGDGTLSISQALPAGSQFARLNLKALP